MQSKNTPEKSDWESTAVQNLVRRRTSGNYYGRFTLRGKQKWIPLNTDVFSIAKLRLADKAPEIDRLRGAEAVSKGRARMGELITTYLQRTEANADLRPSSKTSRLTAVKKIKKTWPGIELLEPRSVSPRRVQEWVARFKVEGTKFVPPGAKGPILGNSAASVNKAIDVLRGIMDIAIEFGQVFINPVSVKPPTGRLKKKVLKKKLTLPFLSDIEQMLSAMENNGARGGWGVEAADFCRFLTFSGARKNEAATTTWGCVDWRREQIRIPGTKSETSDRFVPLFPALAALLKKVQARRQAAAVYAECKEAFVRPTDPLFRLGECQKTIDAACAKTGVARLTHHDFRHLFATICIESGVDIPTVSGWMGHNDGGVLAMKTYGHLRQEHSLAAAKKVQFGEIARQAA